MAEESRLDVGERLLRRVNSVALFFDAVPEFEIASLRASPLADHRALADRLEQQSDEDPLVGLDAFSILALTRVTFPRVLRAYLIGLIRWATEAPLSETDRQILYSFVLYLSPRPELAELDWEAQLGVFVDSLPEEARDCLLDCLLFAMRSRSCVLPLMYQDAIDYWTPLWSRGKCLIARVRTLLPVLPPTPKSIVDSLRETATDWDAYMADVLERADPEELTSIGDLPFDTGPAFRYGLRAKLVWLVKGSLGIHAEDDFDPDIHLYEWVMGLSPIENFSYDWSSIYLGSVSAEERCCIYDCLKFAVDAQYEYLEVGLRAAVEIWVPDNIAAQRLILLLRSTNLGSHVASDGNEAGGIVELLWSEEFVANDFMRNLSTGELRLLLGECLEQFLFAVSLLDSERFDSSLLSLFLARTSMEFSTFSGFLDSLNAGQIACLQSCLSFAQERDAEEKRTLYEPVLARLNAEIAEEQLRMMSLARPNAFRGVLELQTDIERYVIEGVLKARRRAFPKG